MVMKFFINNDQGQYYHHVKDILGSIESGGYSSQTKHRYWLYYLVCVIISSRYAITGYFLSMGDATYFQYDIYFALLKKERFYEGFFFVCAAGLPLFGLALHYLIYYHPDAKIWLRMHDLIVRNRDQFLRSNPELRWQRGIVQSMLNPVESVKMVNRIVRSLWSGRNVRFGGQAKMVYFRNFPVQVRARVMLIVWLFEALYAVANVMFALLMPSVIVSMCIEAGSIYATFVLIFIDFPLNSIYNLIFFRGIFLLSCIGILFYYLSCTEYVQLNQLLGQCTKSGIDYRFNQFHLVHILAQYRVRHSSMTHFIIHFNQRLLSRTIFYFLLTNFFCNVYLIVFLFFRSISRLHKVVFISFLIFQMSVPLFGIMPIIIINRLITSSASYLVSLQIGQLNYVHSSIIMHKLKTQLYYEMLSLKNKRLISLTVGPWGRVTNNSIVQFWALYSGYVMTFWGKFMNK